jgi:hypothetical protein
VNRPTTGRRRAASITRRLACIVFLAAAALPACGKKGPPLPPLVRVPVRPDPFVARRLGSTVYLQVHIPTANADGTSPADIERVEVYGFTGIPLDEAEIFKYGTLVASIPVRKPPDEEGTPPPPEKRHRRAAEPKAARPAAAPRPPASMENGFDQGDTVVVTEPLGPAQFAEVVPTRPAKKPAPPVEPEEKASLRPLGPAPMTPLPARLYVAVGINHKGQKGAVSARQSVVLSAPASAPSEPTITYDESAFTISWTPPANAYPEPPPAAGVLKSTPIGSRPVFGAYNVYEVPPPQHAPGAAAVPVPPAPGGQLPTPVNDKPIPAPPFVDKRIEFGTPRCYVVRAVTLFGTASIEGEASPERCVTPVDTFPPPAPTSLKAVGSEGAVSLIWDASKAADLAGYLVLRATLPGGEFTPLTPGPITETTFTDSTVTAGVRYAYVVVAVDKAKNVSARSNQVEESAR